MFEAFEAVRAAWQTIEFVSLWSGLSVGTLVALGFLGYLKPATIKFAAQAAVLVVVAWSCLMHGHIAGRADEAAALKVLSDTDDKNAAASAAADDKARAADLEAKAKAQHDQDLGEIASMGGDGCSFDPDAGSLQSPSGDVPAAALRNHAKPAAVAKAPRKSAAGAATRQGLRFPLVWPAWLQGKKHPVDAAPDGQ